MKFLFDNEVIFLYATGQPHAIGGAERQQWLLARALARQGHEVVVYSRIMGSRDSMPEEQAVEGVIFRGLPIESPWRAWPKMLAREKPDWWYWRCADWHLGLLVALAHFHGAKVAFACAYDEDCRPHKALTRRSRLNWRNHLWPFYGLGLWLSDCILVQHEVQRRMLPGILLPKAHWVPSLAGAIASDASKTGYVAWVGALREHKRPHVLIEIARRLPELQFVVCGPGTEHATRRSYTQTILPQLRSIPNIDYRGQVSPEEAEEVIARAGLFLSTSIQEGFPNTWLQAWGAGVPVVSVGLDPGGVIGMTGAGVVAPDVDLAVQEVAGLLGDSLASKRLGLKGQAYVSATHSEAFVLERLFLALA